MKHGVITRLYKRIARSFLSAGLVLNILVLAILMLVLLFINSSNLGYFSNDGELTALAFGFILIASFVCGRIARRIGLPALTGYLMAGFVFGPELMGAYLPSFAILTPEVLQNLSIFNTIALGLIALSAGGEMALDVIRKSFKSIVFVSVGQGIAAIFVTVPVILIVGRQFSIFSGLTLPFLLGVALVLSVICMANSPSSTLALIVEYRAKGQLTTTSLGVTILKDVVVIIMFSLALLVAKQLGDSEGKMELALVGTIAWEVFGSIIIGLILGYIVGQYIKYVDRESPMIMLAISFFAMELAILLHLSGLLLCMTCGFYVVNFTNRGQMMINALEEYSLPIFVLFFTITGANLELSSLMKVWPAVLLIVATRTLSIWAGTTGASAIAKDPPVVRRNLWLGFITQAGVTLGLASLIKEQIPQIGGPLMTIIVAAVAINQIIGPIAFKIALLRSGEGKVE